MTLSSGDVSSETHGGTVGEVAVGTAEDIEGRSLGSIAWRRLRHDRVAMVSLGFIIFVLVVAILAPLIIKAWGLDAYAQYPKEASPDNGYLPYGCIPGDHSICTGHMTWKHPLGIEPGIGRDVFARLLTGARISLFIALSATFVSIVLGTIFGAIAGYRGGWLDGFVGRSMDLLLAFPQLILLISLTPIMQDFMENRLHLPPGNTTRIIYLITFIGFLGWPYFGRIIRGQVLSLREREFIEAARSLGAGTGHIIFRQLLPNLWASILVYASLIIPAYIATEAALSYLGVGVLPPTPTWGNMLADSARLAIADPAYLAIPGLALFLVVLAFNLLGDALRDVLDPKSSR